MDVEFGVVSAFLTFWKVNLKVPATVGVEGSVVAVYVNLFETRHLLVIYQIGRNIYFIL